MPGATIAHASRRWARSRNQGGAQPFLQLRPAPSARHVAYSNGNRLALADEDNQSLSTGYAGIEQIALQHGVVLGQDRDNDRWIFGPLALVDRHGIGWH